jgi:uncharacterized protein YcbK (DUF882 family)
MAGGITRRALLGTALAVAVAPPSHAEGATLAAAASASRARRRVHVEVPDWLDLHNLHTGERLHVQFRNAAGFIQSALNRLDRLLRDHRSGQHRSMDPQLYALLAELAAAARAEPRYEIISGFRSAETNEKLRANGGGQAKNSQHIVGKAIDVRLKGVPTERVRDLAVAMKRGGVGWYRKSNFVHIDTARVRYWEG